MRNIKKIGALTSKPYSFQSRPWELKYLESIDLNDSLGSNIKIHYKNSQILRILPNINENVNEEWITDKIRFSYDSLNRWRFNTPLIKKENYFIQASWQEAFSFIKKFIKKNPKHLTNIFGNSTASIESLLSLKLLSFKIPYINVQLDDFKNQANNDILYNNLLNVEKYKIHIFIGSNLRLENPILNLKFRKLSKINSILIGYIGASYNSTCYMQHLGNNVKTILNLLKGKNKFCFLINKITYNILPKKQKLSFILGLDYQSRFDSHHLESLLKKFSYSLFFKSIKISFLKEYISEVNSNLINFENNKLLYSKFNTIITYLLGTENINVNPNKLNFIIFMGHHNNKLRKLIDVILPTFTYLESTNLHLNVLNILQKTNSLQSISKHSRDEFLVITMLHKFIYLNTSKYNTKLKLNQYLTTLIGKRSLNKKITTYYQYTNNKFLHNNTITYYSAFKNNKINFYLSNSFTTASKNMQECSKAFFFNKNSYLWN